MRLTMCVINIYDKYNSGNITYSVEEQYGVLFKQIH